MSVIASIISCLKYIRHNDFFEHELTKGLSMDSFLVTNKCQFGLLSAKPFSIFFSPMRALQRWKLMFSEDTVTVLASRNHHPNGWWQNSKCLLLYDFISYSFLQSLWAMSVGQLYNTTHTWCNKMFMFLLMFPFIQTHFSSHMSTFYIYNWLM